MTVSNLCAGLILLGLCALPSAAIAQAEEAPPILLPSAAFAPTNRVPPDHRRHHRVDLGGQPVRPTR